MSLYTNDTDTLRQMINQSIPQVLMSVLTIIVTFISMLVLSPLLTILAVLMIMLMFFVSRFITGNSGKYFIRQQIDLADVTGFVEERMNGQKVVKVFNHETISEKEFDELNERLFESASKAHTFASIMGPVVGNMGNISFRSDGSVRRISVGGRNRKYYAGCYGILSAVYQKLHAAVYADCTAVQLHYHGAGRSRTDLRTDG